MPVHWCFHCYGLNAEPVGRCRHCGREIAAPEDLSFEARLIWALGHPDGDRAMLAARTLGQRRVRSAIPHLRELAAHGADPFLAAQALRSLLAIEDTTVLRPLLDELASNGPFMVAEIAAAALRG